MSRLIALPVFFAALIAASAVRAQMPASPPGLPPSLPQVVPPPPPVAPAQVPPSVSGRPIEPLSQPRITTVPYASPAVRYTVTPKRSKKRWHKRRNPRVSDIVIVRQI